MIATAWGNKFGGINNFSTNLSKAFPKVLVDCQIFCACYSATYYDIIEAETFGINLIDLKINKEPEDSIPDIIISQIEAKHFEYIIWIGHDIITGNIANKCKNKIGGVSAVFMHMSYNDYAFLKHKPTDALNIREKIDQQKDIFKSSDFRFAVGPLLHNRLIDLTETEQSNYCIIPGLTNYINDSKPRDKINAISYGRFDETEVFTKQFLLTTSAFANAFKIGVENHIKSLRNASLKIIGASNDVIEKIKKSTTKQAGRVVNIQQFPFIEDTIQLNRLLQECNLCLMPSWHEGFGLVAWEAISAGIPVIISQNSGVHWLLEEIGGTALGCVYIVDINGTNDGSPDKEDIQAITNEITKIANNISAALKNAQSLKDLLKNKGYSWNSSAETVADILKLQSTSTLITSASYIDSEFNDMLDISNAKELISRARNHYQIGEYLQAITLLTELKLEKNLLSKSYSISLEATLVECEIRLRLNQYSYVLALIRKITDATSDRLDVDKYIQAKFVENVVYRDIGEYDKAITIAEEIISLAKDKPLLLESGYRKLSRSLSLKGLCKKAIDFAFKAQKMSILRGFPDGEPTSNLALGEAYRHGLDYTEAIKWYKMSMNLSSLSGNTDCYLWAVLGICDCNFLLNENPIEMLLKNVNFIKKYDSFPLEKLHFDLSLFAVNVRFNELREFPSELVTNYEALGINWPRNYIFNILKGDFSNPKMF